MFAAVAGTPAWAVDYRSVDPAAAVMFDTPSANGKKLYVIRRFTPLEVVVSLEGWVKVRDQDGSLAWIERKSLSERRTVIVTVPRAEIRSAPDADANVVFEADRSVALDVTESPKDGWVRVRHVDGQSGFVRVTQIWGV